MSEARSEHHVIVDNVGDVPVDVLATASGLSKQKIKRAMKAGAVWITYAGRKGASRLRRVKRALHAGDELHLYYDEHVLNSTPQEPRLVADEGAYSVWDKPMGMLSQGSKWGDEHTIARWAETKLQPQRRAFIVHRLDRAATGLIMIAHGKKAAAELSALFQQRSLEKHYRVTVEGLYPDEPGLRVLDAELDGKRPNRW